MYTLFSLCGPVRRVIMGIHKYTHLPCGFCFVEFSHNHYHYHYPCTYYLSLYLITISFNRYYFHRDAMAARDYLNGTKLDDRIIRVDLDPGFEPGRQFGRGATGGQVRDDRRHDYDEGRGGLPPRHKQRIEKHAIAQGQLVGPTNGPINNDTHSHLRHRYEQNMTVNDAKDDKDNKQNKDNDIKDNKDKDKDKDIKEDKGNNNENKDNQDNNVESKKENDNITTNNGNNHENKMETDNDDNNNDDNNNDDDNNDDNNNNDNSDNDRQNNGEHNKDKEMKSNDIPNDTKSVASELPKQSSSEDQQNTTDNIQEPPLKKQKIDT